MRDEEKVMVQLRDNFASRCVEEDIEELFDIVVRETTMVVCTEKYVEVVTQVRDSTLCMEERTCGGEHEDLHLCGDHVKFHMV